MNRRSNNKAFRYPIKYKFGDVAKACGCSEKTLHRKGITISDIKGISLLELVELINKHKKNKSFEEKLISLIRDEIETHSKGE